MKLLIKQPIKIGNISINNRLVMPPMETRKATPDGYVTDDIIHYYKERAKGSVIGIIITEHLYVSQEGKAVRGQLGISDDKYIEGLSQIAKAIKLNGPKAIAQISHAGSAAPASEVGKENIIGPSAVINPAPTAREKHIPKALTINNIDNLKNKFVIAALRSKQAGFDGVELHSAHGYLLNQFYSPITNKRTDIFGCQSVENRLRFTLDIIHNIRKAVGNDYLIGLRLGAIDYNMENGSTIEDVTITSKILSESQLNFIDISGGLNGISCGYTNEPGYFSDASSIVKASSNLPVILTGGIRTIEQAETLIKNKKADLIGIGRPIFAKADWAYKAMNI